MSESLEREIQSKPVRDFLEDMRKRAPAELREHVEAYRTLITAADLYVESIQRDVAGLNAAIKQIGALTENMSNTVVRILAGNMLLRKYEETNEKTSE